ncbi:SfnB family sulfur acquisition oxidoreductase [Acetobacter fallax]|uniref:Dibenzothiophene monooxygenase n=1 Tax=Acetobacter fallax TaxID=1737473 RepID=A0ABX0KHK0_9PROT|nr:SfnB family sulfur acquisition oxidoreductase [Acetobacter fallax]NHO33885.1 SfnB family sulfur acquisition oxidoreductase [Acetobacter fallax]NHO37433.1 SfnB family sulfur acquisition oxidoreductase [Acetobacter fallax]
MISQIVVGGGEAVPPPPWPRQAAFVIRNNEQALDAARRIAVLAEEGAVRRDREDLFPGIELDAFSSSGLWGITVPAAWGGADLSYVTVGRVAVTIAAADSSLAQLVQNHWATIAAIRSSATEEQKADLFPLILEGQRFGNAFSERGTKNVSDLRTRLIHDGDEVILNGVKHYCTGALAADLIQIVALDENGLSQLAIAERNSPGLTVFNDWTAFGQRGTGSGRVVIENVRVPASRVIAVWKAYVPEAPFPDSAISQFIQAAIDGGIAQGALRETEKFVLTRTRPWVDSGAEKAADDPYIIQAIGSLNVRLSAALALLDEAGRSIDTAVHAPSPDTVAAAQIAVAKAKILTTEIAIEAADRLFELAGTASTDRNLGLDRYWRNARAHTLHDPVRWKYAIVGEYYLNGRFPPLHPWS